LFSLYFRYYTQTFFVTRLIINQINKVQWVDFKLENVLASLHSLKTMGLGPFGLSAPIFLRNGELLGHSPILNWSVLGSPIVNWILNIEINLSIGCTILIRYQLHQDNMYCTKIKTLISNLVRTTRFWNSFIRWRWKPKDWKAK
jgi:hypothetical protein